MNDKNFEKEQINFGEQKKKAGVVDYVNLLRLKHYIKNLLIFAPLFFSAQIFQVDKLMVTIVYIVNDIRDVEKDRLHPVKCKRPIAAGKITKSNACIIAVVLLIIAYAILIISKSNWMIISLLSVYIIINLGYSLGLKNIPILDVALLSAGFLIRVIYGGMVADVIVSSWLYLTVIALSFYMGLGKRRNELRKIKSAETRKVMEQYSDDFLDRNMYMCLALGLVFYSLWAVERANNFMWTIPIVLLICMKYNLTLEGEAEGDPVSTLLASKSLLGVVAIYVVLAMVLIYV